MGIWDLINKLTSRVNSAVEENVAPAVKEYVHNEEGRGRINRLATSFVRKAAVKGFHVGLKWVPGGFLISEVVKEGLKDQPSKQNSNKNKKSELTAKVEEMQVKMETMQQEVNTVKQEIQILMEKMQEEKNMIKQQNQILMERVQEELNITKQKMIRSRL